MIKSIINVLLLTIYGISCSAQTGTAFKKTLPSNGEFINNKPVGAGWVNLLDSPVNWNAEKQYWQWKNKILHGEAKGDTVHHYSWTSKIYADFELNVLIKMTGGEDANSGVCIRIHPTNWDNVPGYQVDMGKGYWGSLWEERRADMVQKYPDSLAAKLVKTNDWNHYYIIAKGHHIQAWLNGVKTIDIVHDAGFTDGNIGFQLCHERRYTVVDIKSLYIREIK
ncbi:MAG: DUF1080 domain-containing protein [Chitinophagaceae bacterium]